MSQKKQIRNWKYIVLIILIFATLYTDTKIFFYDGRSAISSIEFLIYIMNHQINICFYLLFFVCFVVGDIYDNTKINNTNRKKLFIDCYLKKAVIIPILCLILYIILGIISYLMRYNYIDLSNTWSLEPDVYLTPVSTFLTSTLLLSLRFISFSLIIFIINIVSKYPIGIVVPIFISIIDYWFYEVFDILNPLNILPIEHTRVFYTEAVASTAVAISRSSYTISYLYWFVFIIILLVIFKIVISKRKGIKGECL